MRIVEVLTTPFAAPHRGQTPADPSYLRLHSGQSMLAFLLILTCRELGKLLAFSRPMLSHIIQNDLDEAKGRLGNRLIPTIDQPKQANYRIWYTGFRLDDHHR